MSIYIIDEKKDRQKEYNWTNERFDKYNIICIRNYETLKEIGSHQICQKENIVCLHDSFFKNLNLKEKDREIFDKKLRDIYKYIIFGGGINFTNITNNVAVLPVSSFYIHLDSFLKNKEYTLEILVYGENYEKEKKLKLKNMLLEKLFSLKSKEILSEDMKKDILKTLGNDNIIKEILKNNNTVLEIKNILTQLKI